MFIRDAISLPTQINLQCGFIKATFSTCACSELFMPLVNGCIDCSLFNTLPNVYLHNWKAWVMQQKYCNNVVLMSPSGRKINEQIKTREIDTTWEWHGSVATDLRGSGSSNARLLCISFSSLTVKNYENLRGPVLALGL